jgi:ABC transporter, ATP-binding/permease protein
MLSTYKRLFKYVPEKIHCVYLSIFFSVVGVVLQMSAFWYLWKFLYAVLVTKSITDGKFAAVTIVSLMLANIIVLFAAVWASHILGFRLENNLRKVAIEHLMNASFAFFDVHESGTVRKIIDDNAQNTHQLVAHLIPDNIAAFFTPVLMFVVVFMVDIKLGMLLVAMAAIGFALMLWTVGDRKFMQQYQAALEKMNGQAVEYVRGMQVIKIFRSTVESFKAFYKAIVDYSDLAYKYTLSCRVPFVLFQVLFNLFPAFTIPFAIYFMNKGADGNLIIAKIVFFVCIAGVLFASFMRVMYVGMYSMQARSAVDKLEQIVDEMEKDNIAFGTNEKFEHYGVEFKHVSFGYTEETILHDVSFKLEQNKTYALVGSSGGGKSTIAKLISGFYKINNGEILIGGKNITSYSKNALMKNIAFVFQTSKLFKTSIFENVKMGNQKASYEDVMNALRLARCEDILDKFPEREKTIIGSKGVYLSGGEVQRIAIARAILKNASIIILDEASAAADPENEYEIQQAFSTLMKNKTVIMIAHRLGSIKNVDEILVVEKGAIIERGSDKDLMSKGGVYRHLQDLYSKANEWKVG